MLRTVRASFDKGQGTAADSGTTYGVRLRDLTTARDTQDLSADLRDLGIQGYDTCRKISGVTWGAQVLDLEFDTACNRDQALDIIQAFTQRKHHFGGGRLWNEVQALPYERGLESQGARRRPITRVADPLIRCTNRFRPLASEEDADPIPSNRQREEATTPKEKQAPAPRQEGGQPGQSQMILSSSAQYSTSVWGGGRLQAEPPRTGITCVPYNVRRDTGAQAEVQARYGLRQTIN